MVFTLIWEDCKEMSLLRHGLFVGIDLPRYGRFVSVAHSVTVSSST